MISQYAYYSTRSGLTPVQNFSLNDHRLAYFRAQVASTAGSLNDNALAFYIVNTTGVPAGSPLSAYEYAYFAAGTGLAVDIDTMKATYFVAHP